MANGVMSAPNDNNVLIRNYRGSSTSDTFYMSASSRALVYMIDSKATLCGAWSFWSISDGTVFVKEIIGASGITVTTAKNNIIFSREASSLPDYIVFTVRGGQCYLT